MDGSHEGSDRGDDGWSRVTEIEGIIIMALITFTGYPCSGKSKRTQQLKVYLESKLADAEYHGPALKVVVLSDDSLDLSRSVYDGI